MSLPPNVVITPFHPESMGLEMSQWVSTAFWGDQTSDTWQTANRALYVPFTLSQPINVRKLFCVNGGTAAGNVDMGIYTDDGTRLVSIGSTAQSGTNAIQEFDITDTLLGPGKFYLAIAMSSTSGTVAILVMDTAYEARAAGLLQQDSAFPLPATATFAAVDNSRIPFCGLTTRSLI